MLVLFKELHKIFPSFLFLPSRYVSEKYFINNNQKKNAKTNVIYEKENLTQSGKVSL